MLISEFIYSWLKDIVVLFIIITLVDLIMPKGDLKRHMNFIVGLIVIFMIISPFLKLFSMDFKLNKSVLEEYKNQEFNNIDFTKEQTEKIESLYIEKLHSKIDLIIQNNSEYKIENMNVNMDRSEVGFGDISSIEIKLIKNTEIEIDSKKKINIAKIANIDIKDKSNSDKDNVDGGSQINNNKFNQLKIIISEELGISDDLIFIYTNG